MNDTAAPWHDGERALQASVGAVDRMEAIGRKVLRRFMPDQHREFYQQLPFVLTGVVDSDDQPWATVLTGAPGFMLTPDDKTLNVNVLPSLSDPARSAFVAGAGIGFLGIELNTRRRNRINGVINSTDESKFSVGVEQTMGNCPKYIQLRDIRFEKNPPVQADVDAVTSATLDPAAVATIRSADSFYVASYADVHGKRQVDVSHRGGKPGFVRVDDNGVLTIPDFEGNNFFNTLGNIELNGKAGLIFVNYETGDVLQITGTARVILESPEIAAFSGAQRLWAVTPTRVVRRTGALSVRWTLQEMSPYVLDKGSWEAAAAILGANRSRASWSPLRVVRVVDESSVIRSFYFEPAQRDPRESFMAGQHLPIRVYAASGKAPVQRTYTLSSAPSDKLYRISVKREGKVSSFLHDHVGVGDLIEARPPQGGFTIDIESARPVVMLAGGVGITPMISMTRELVAEVRNGHAGRDVWLFQSARSPDQRAFDQELSDLMRHSEGTVRRVRAGTDETTMLADDPFYAGRIDINLLRSVLPFDDFDFYLCGPPSFMQTLYDALRSMGVRDMRIFAESFGPAALTRRKTTQIETGKPSDLPIEVVFEGADQQIQWKPGQGTLLELAEDSGLNPPYSCRAGNCGTCRTKLVFGKVAYSEMPSYNVDDDEVLICCAVPAASEEASVNRVVLAI